MKIIQGGLDIPSQWRLRSLVSFTQNPVVMNAWYTFATLGSTQVSYLSTYQNSGGARTVELELLVDGVTFAGSRSQADVTTYYWVLNTALDAFLTPTTTVTPINTISPVYGRSIRGRFRTTSAGGAYDLIANSRVMVL